VTTTPSKPDLRRTLKALRRAIPPLVARGVARKVAAKAWKIRPLGAARRIAGYAATGSELDLWPLLHAACSRGRQVYLPVVQRGELWFAPWKPGAAMGTNRYNIAEARAPRHRWRRAHQLDVVLAPLVGFDSRGIRLGMGGGFYDRALKQHRHRHHYRRPHFIGIAYECQFVTELPADSWDARLDGVVTEERLHLFSKT
jgi:5-formyltetrahydrofolate cyclo-ligase